MNNELLTILEYIERERGISRENLIRALESAILTASKKSIHPANELKVKIDPASGNIQAWAVLEVVESTPNNNQLIIDRAREKMPDVKVGDIVEWEVTPRNFGRIAAQTAKQAIMQQLRRAEKETVREEFADRIAQIINGTVRRFEAGSIVIDFGKAEGVLSSRDKIHGEQYMPGDRINVLLRDVDTLAAGPSLIVSRTDPNFVVRLFEREVAEIRDGVVQIKAIAREAGSRSKIAVASSDTRVDPVGACVGVRGARVRNITDELGGERVDIVPYDEDIRKFTMNALQPAQAKSIELDEAAHTLVVHVASDQSKLAFGKKAQNVRLASKLVGWNINIQSGDGETAEKTAETLEDKINKAASELAEALGVSEDTAGKLVRSGYVSVEGVKEAGIDPLLEIEGIDREEIQKAFERFAD